MAKPIHNSIWKRAPFLRLLIPVIIGILIENYFNLQITVLLISGIISFVSIILFSFFSEAIRFHYRSVQGFVITIFLVVFGCVLVWQKDVRNHSDWYGNYYQNESYIKARIDEPPVEKAKSFKAVAVAEEVINKGKETRTTGRFLIYFKKDSGSQKLRYGDVIIFRKALLRIKGTGNPGAFDYEKYSALHQLFHQVYLKENEWILIKIKEKNYWAQFIFSVRENIVLTLNKYLGHNNESTIAKAILIGYKVDLDKDLVQAYSNAGVVHLIAISGLHMGIIYGLLIWLFSYLPLIKKSKPVRLISIILFLWLFALLTGASPSVLRAAVMFSFIAVGNAFNKKSSIYNSLAASAFLLLSFNPFILWDVGFQLSYLAVLGIVIGQKNISNWIYLKNKYAQKIWELAAVSIAAQLFTFPLCFYYFHQLPLLFMFSNMIAIPLATLTLWGCLLLVFISPITIAAFYFGKLLYGIIWLLNSSVLFFDSIPFALWRGVSLSFMETTLLYMIVCFSIYGLMRKNKNAFKTSLILISFFCVFCLVDKWYFFSQKKLIVYNIPTFKAVEFIDRYDYTFFGDSLVMDDKLLYGFNLKPAHILLGINDLPQKETIDLNSKPFYQFYHSRVLMIDHFINFSSSKKINIDYIILSKNPGLNLADLVKNFNCKKYIFDSSNPTWKIEQWKKECEELHLQFHSVPEQGAFVTDL